MSDTRSSSPPKGRHGGSVELGEAVYRYFFYGWLFRDAENGSRAEQDAALRHNQGQAHWLPLYMWRWFVGAVAIAALESMSEHVLGAPLLTASLSVMLVLVVLFLAVTVVCWLFLRAQRDSG